LYSFAAAHANSWAENASRLGISADQANAVKVNVTATSNKQTSHNFAKDALKTGTRELSEQYTTLRRAVSEVVRSITTFAENQPTAKERDEIFNLANIQPPAQRSPSTPPNTATDLRISLDPTTGELTLRWKAAQPRGVNGVVYTVYRTVAGVTAIAGATGSKSFIDSTMPAGTTRVQYFVRAQRGSLLSSPSSTIDVRFGPGGPGFTATFHTTAENAGLTGGKPKLAA
jgi:hypothetical protein